MELCIDVSSRVVVLILLLPFICCENPQLKLIGELNKFFNFDHNVFLLELSVDINRFISSTSHAPQTVYTFMNATENIADLETEVRSFLTSIDFLRKLCKWCKEHLIVNVFAAIDGSATEDALNIFTFHPFGMFDVIKVTTSESYENYFPSLQSNFQQQMLLAYYPFPHSMAEQIWKVVLRMMNGSFIVSNVRNEYDYFGNRDTSMSLRIFIQMDIYSLNAYPLSLGTMPYEDFSAYLRVVTSDKFFGFSLVTIAALVFFLTVCRYIKESKVMICQSAADVLNLLMSDNGYIRYQQLSRAEVLIIIPLTFVGLVVVSGILSNLQSYLTRPVLQPQIKTLEDIYSSPFPILTLDEGWRLRIIGLLADRTKHEDWNDKIICSQLQYKELISKFNMSASFYGSDVDNKVRLRAQKRLDIKGYYNPKLQISQYFVSYLLSDKFLFFDRYNDIIHRIKSAGLIDLWQYRHDYDYEYFILDENVERLNQLQVNDVQKIEFPMFIVYGWAASSVLFILEIISKKFKISRMKKFQRFFIATSLQRLDATNVLEFRKFQ